MVEDFQIPIRKQKSQTCVSSMVSIEGLSPQATHSEFLRTRTRKE